jgi:two-component system, OmpR family, sensor histidine kinase KdpD
VRRDLFVGIPAAAGAVAVVSALVALLEPHVPVLSLGVLYVFAVLPVAVLWGTPLALAVSVASMLAFNWFFLPPKHTFQLRDGANWAALAVYCVTGVVVGLLAARARRRSADAEQRRREAHVLAEAAADLLRGTPEERALERLAEPLAGALRVDALRLVPGAQGPDAGETAVPVTAGSKTVATLLVDEALEVDAHAAARLLPALGALFAVEADALETEALRRSDALKTALLRSVSHDLRSPLTAILASAGALANDDLRIDADDRRELALAIRDEARRLDRVVGDLLDVSRLQAGAVEPHRELWSADELVAQALDTAGSVGGIAADARPEDRAARGDGSARVRVELDEQAPPVRVDGAQVERALANLIDNALKFSPPDSPVLVRVEHGATELRIHVVDHGPGVHGADRARLFEPFRGEGTGLGLAIARGFAEVNGGAVWAQDDPTGGHFVLALPAGTVGGRAGPGT